MTIKIIEQEEEYIINYDHREIRIEKPVTIEDVKKAAREAFDAVGKKVNWKLF